MEIKMKKKNWNLTLGSILTGFVLLGDWLMAVLAIG